MKTGPKEKSVAEKRAQGSFQPCRTLSVVTLVEPLALPQQPEWLTEDGRAVWLDNIGRISSSRGATEIDTDLLGNFCNLQGAVAKAWRAGDVPPVSAMVEVRKMMELLRIAGPSSRIVKIETAPKGGGNPFARNGSRT